MNQLKFSYTTLNYTTFKERYIGKILNLMLHLSFKLLSIEFPSPQQKLDKLYTANLPD